MSQRKRSQSVTLKDIAREVNLCTSSVSAALAGRSGNTLVSPATVLRVQEVARRLNYRAHVGARAMRSNRYHNLGYFLASQDKDHSYVSAEVQTAVCEAAGTHDYNVTLLQLPRDLLSVIPRAFRESHLDALIMTDIRGLPEELLREIDAKRWPVVYYNSRHQRNAIYVNDIAGAEALTKHLIGTGRRRISFLRISGNNDHDSVADRIRGYTETMEAAGLKATFCWLDEYGLEREFLALMQSPKAPEAVFCYDDWLALTFQQFLLRHGYKIPDDVAVAGCNDEYLATLAPIPLTTISIPWREMATAAVDMAIRQVNEVFPDGLESREFIPTVKVREST